MHLGWSCLDLDLGGFYLPIPPDTQRYRIQGLLRSLPWIPSTGVLVCFFPLPTTQPLCHSSGFQPSVWGFETVPLTAFGQLFFGSCLSIRTCFVGMHQAIRSICCPFFYCWQRVVASGWCCGQWMHDGVLQALNPWPNSYFASPSVRV